MKRTDSVQKVALIDNYDSFTYNLAHLLKELGADVTVFRNDKFELPQLQTFDKLVLSPGPGIPQEAGLLLEVIKQYAGIKPILGICLGEQAIAVALGGSLINLSEVFHGVQTPVNILKDSHHKYIDPLFNTLPQTLQVGRYHSWVVNPHTLPADLQISAESQEGQIMGICHKAYKLHGIQFHPESVLTPDGRTLIANFLNE